MHYVLAQQVRRVSRRPVWLPWRRLSWLERLEWLTLAALIGAIWWWMA